MFRPIPMVFIFHSIRAWKLDITHYACRCHTLPQANTQEEHTWNPGCCKDSMTPMPDADHGQVGGNLI
jgi:hypothetical protein